MKRGHLGEWWQVSLPFRGNPYPHTVCELMSVAKDIASEYLDSDEQLVSGRNTVDAVAAFRSGVYKKIVSPESILKQKGSSVRVAWVNVTFIT